MEHPSCSSPTMSPSRRPPTERCSRARIVRLPPLSLTNSTFLWFRWVVHVLSSSPLRNSCALTRHQRAGFARTVPRGRQRMVLRRDMPNHLIEHPVGVTDPEVLRAVHRHDLGLR